MQVAFIARATLYTVRGGDTLQVTETARQLNAMGVQVDVKLTNEPIDYSKYDLLHFFNIIRPADMLCHIRRSHKPFVVSTQLIDYSGYDKLNRKGIAGMICRFLSEDGIEYAKTIGRYLLGRDKLMTRGYLWQGQRRSIREILERASLLFAGSEMESKKLAEQYRFSAGCMSIPNGLDPELFRYEGGEKKDDRLVLCVARVEGIKNQLNLIKALNDTGYRLLIIGDQAPGQSGYYHQCRKIAASNVTFLSHIPQSELVKYYQMAKVHILPSWWETCGLSSLEAGVMGCNIVITDKGYTREYYEDYAFYCDPGSPASIRLAVDRAAGAAIRPGLREKILTNYTWRRSADGIAHAYDQILKVI
jgi:glycosyltransferase involved in cell wall biosynthesis